MPGTRKWFFLVLSLLIGTLLGYYLQQFDPLSRFFEDFLSLGFDLKRMDLAFLDIGLSFHLHCNLGTLMGGLLGLWVLR